MKENETENVPSEPAAESGKVKQVIKMDDKITVFGPDEFLSVLPEVVLDPVLTKSSKSSKSKKTKKAKGSFNVTSEEYQSYKKEFDDQFEDQKEVTTVDIIPSENSVTTIEATEVKEEKTNTQIEVFLEEYPEEKLFTKSSKSKKSFPLEFALTLTDLKDDEKADDTPVKKRSTVSDRSHSQKKKSEEDIPFEKADEVRRETHVTISDAVDEDDKPILPSDEAMYYDDDLPAHWTKHYDDNYDCFYYVNSITGKTQWEFPEEDGTAPAAAVDENMEKLRKFNEKNKKRAKSLTSMHFEWYNSEEYRQEFGTGGEESKGTSPLPPAYSPRKSKDHEDDDEYNSTLAYTMYDHDTYNPATSSSLLKEHSLLSNYQSYGEDDDYDRDQLSPTPYEYRENIYNTRKFYSSSSSHLKNISNKDFSSHKLIPSPRTAQKHKNQGPQHDYHDDDEPKRQDYASFARLYKLQRPYMDPALPALCLLCHKNYAADVFFPCQHHCICRACIRKENICDEKTFVKMSNNGGSNSGYCMCSLCGGIIKLILPLEGGKEIDKYWQWVYEEKIVLSKEFMRNWKHSAGVIQTVYVDDNEATRKNNKKEKPPNEKKGSFLFAGEGFRSKSFSLNPRRKSQDRIQPEVLQAVHEQFQQQKKQQQQKERSTSPTSTYCVIT
jgi:hypothetical protein